MPPHFRRHDIYDDTHHAHEHPHSRVPVLRRHTRSTSPENHPSVAMQGPMHRFHQDVERSLGGFGFASLFGDPGPASLAPGNMWTLFDRMADQTFSSIPNDLAAGNNGATYFYESRTRTVGPDGRVKEEHVRTVPDEQGNPRTRRSVRETEVERDMGSFFGRGEGSLGNFYDRIENRGGQPDVIVEEVEDDVGEAAHRSRGTRRPRSHYGDVEIEEIDDENADADQTTGDWVRERYRRWRSRH